MPIDQPSPSGESSSGMRWAVWRQDDNGNQYEVARRASREEAEAFADAMQVRGHKQTYRVAPVNR